MIIPTLDAAATITAALDSVLAQDPNPAEVLVVDGGSTDETRDIVDAYTGVRLLVDDGSGIGEARNRGIASTASSLIAYCDADDRWPEGSLDARLRALTDDAAVVIGRLRWVASTERSPTAAQWSRLGGIRPGYTPGAALFRRSVFERVGGFDEVMRVGADSEWFMRMRLADVRIVEISDVVLEKSLHAAARSTDVETYRRDLLIASRRHLATLRRRRSP